MDKRTIIAGLIVLLIVLLVAGNAVYETPEHRYESSRDMMDTYVNIIIYHNDKDEATEIMDEAYERMAEVADIANRFKDGSEISRLNDNGIIDDASPELLEMFQLSIQYSTITDGAFDITVLPILNLWNASSGSGPYLLFSMNASQADALDSGTVSDSIRSEFIAADDLYNLSGDASVTVTEPGKAWVIHSAWKNYQVSNVSGELTVTIREFWNVNTSTQGTYINETKQFVGSDKITISDRTITILPGMSITLDGMSKGYIVDEAIEVLRSNGIERALVNAGGDIATIGEKPEGEKWEVGLKNPDDSTDSVTEFVISGKAITTSGNYERFFDANKTIGYVYDPITGYPVYKGSSATIIADNCTVADILSTGVLVLGPDRGIEVVETLQNVETLLLGYDNPQEIHRSTGISAYEVQD